MRRALALMMGLSLVVMFTGVALADGFGMCSYGSHTKQVMADKADASKTVATKAATSIDGKKLIVAQTEQPTKPAPATKK